MKLAIKWIEAAILFGCFIYFLSPGQKHFIQEPTAWEFREQLVYLTGTCAMSLMVLSMLISIRSAAINKLTKGLDKAYVVHKWTGIFTTVFVLLHWLTEYIPHWLVQLNFILNPGELTDGSEFSDIEIFLFQSGVTIAQFLFYIFLLLIATALIKKIPYSFFRKTHKIFPIVFLLFAYHAGTSQLKEHWIGSAGSYMLFLLLSIGIFAALIVLFKQIGSTHQSKGLIKRVEFLPNGVCDLQIAVLGKPFLYKAGQYAFLKFEHSTEPHPFTIASGNGNSTNLKFGIKGLGDFTRDLNKNIQVGQQMQIEGPYGEFQFEDSCERQVWVAGGIGITPFMARLDYLSKNGSAKKSIDFWYCTQGKLNTQFPSSIQDLCKECGVNFHHMNSQEQEYLTADLIKETVSNFNDISIWF